MADKRMRFELVGENEDLLGKMEQSGQAFEKLEEEAQEAVGSTAAALDSLSKGGVLSGLRSAIAGAFAGLGDLARQNGEKMKGAFDGMTIGQVKAKIAEVNAEIESLSDRDEIRKKQEEVQALSKHLDSLLSNAKEMSAPGGGGIFGQVFGGTALGMIASKGFEVLTGAVTKLKSSMIDGNAQFEQYETALKVMLGSTKAAKERLKELSDFAATTPFELPEVVSAGNALQSMQKYSQDTLRHLGDLAAGSGKPLEQALAAFGKLASGQKGVAIDMFRDMNISMNDWVLATGKGAKANGEFAGTAEEMIAALPKILEMKGLAGMTEQQAQTFGGLMATLNDTLDTAGRTIGEPIFRVAKRGLVALGDFLNSPAFQGAIQSVSAGLGSIFELVSNNTGVLITAGAALGAYALAVNASTIAETASAVAKRLDVVWTVAKKAAYLALHPSQIMATVNQWQLNAAMSANPIGLVVLAIGALVAGLVWLVTNVKPVREVFQALGSAVLPMLSAAWEGIKKVLGTVWSAMKPVADLVFQIGKLLFNAIILPYRIIWDVLMKAVSAIREWFTTSKTGIEVMKTLGEWLTKVGKYIKEHVARAFYDLKAAADWAIKAFKDVYEWVTNTADALANFSLFGEDKGKAESEAYNREIKKGLEEKARLEREAAELEKRAAEEAARQKGEAVRRVTLAEAIKTKSAELEQGVQALEKQHAELVAKRSSFKGEDLLALNKQIAALETQITQGRANLIAARGFDAVEAQGKAALDAILAKYQYGVSSGRDIAKLRAEYRAAKQELDQVEKDRAKITGEDSKKKSPALERLEQERKNAEAALETERSIALREAREREASELEIKEIEHRFANDRYLSMVAFNMRELELISDAKEKRKAAQEFAREEQAGLVELEDQASEIRLARQAQFRALELNNLEEVGRQRLAAMQRELTEADRLMRQQAEAVKEAEAFRKEFEGTDPVTTKQREIELAERLHDVEIKGLLEKLKILRRISAEEIEQMKRDAEREKDFVRRDQMQKKIEDKEREDARKIAEAERDVAEKEDKQKRAAAVEQMRFAKMNTEAQLAFGKELVGAMGGELGRIFGMQKAAAVAQATINTYEAATTALKAYPPPFGEIAAGIAIASGFAKVYQIQQQQLPAMDKGGIVVAPLIAQIGERRPEAVVPLAELPGIIAKAFGADKQQNSIYAKSRQKNGALEGKVNIGIDTFRKGDKAVRFRRGRGAW